MTDVVTILLCEFVIRDRREALPPEDQRLFDRQTDTFQEQVELLASKVFQMLACPQCGVQIPHTRRSVLHQQIVDHTSGDDLAIAIIGIVRVFR